MIMKRYWILILLTIILAGFTLQTRATQNDEIYDKLLALDIYYEHNEDPLELEDYTEYVQSPYPLIRTSVTLTSQKTKIPPGYYLLTPRTKGAYEFITFKQNGKITALVPIYEKTLIDPKVIYEEAPKPKPRLITWPFRMIKKGFIKLFGKYKRPLKPPKYIIESEFKDGGKYFEIRFYLEQYLYKMLFKVEKDKT
jgi:hypothetical protein